MEMPTPDFVAGIGASAGGLNAYKSFFDALPSNTGMAFAVISHIHPAAHSQLAEILSRHTKMTVVLAASGMKIRANQVYVIPGNADLLIENGALIVVSPRTRRNAQVDIFFTSLATAMGERAVGIVFSGYDGDGAEGCKRIKAAGGTTFAQDTSAEVSGMPLSAQATGCVDFVLSPDKIPAELDKLIIRFAGKNSGGGVNPAYCSSDTIASAQSGHPENVGPGMKARRIDAIMLQTKTVDAKATPFGIEVTFAAAEKGEAGGNASLRPHGQLRK